MMNTIYNFSLTFILSFMFLMTFLNHNGIAQSSSYDLIKKGNQQFEQKKYTDAEVNYRKTITAGKNIKEGSYNLGNAYFKQGKYEEAAKQYESAGALKSLSQDEISKIHHNLGNAFLKEQKYPESINSYKNALKANPKDNDTRYNLAYAQSRLQQQQQQNKNNKDDKNKDKQEKQDQQKQNQDKEKQAQQKQNQDQQEKKDQGEQNPEQAKKDKISKEDADKILQALNNDEKKTQKKINTKQPVKVSIEKQW